MNEGIQRMVNKWLQHVNDLNSQTPEDKQIKEWLQHVNDLNLSGVYEVPNNQKPFSDEERQMILKQMEKIEDFHKTGLFKEDPNKPIVVWELVSPLLARVSFFKSVEFKLRYDGEFVDDMISRGCSDSVLDSEPENMTVSKPILPDRTYWQEVKMIVSCYTGNRRLNEAGKFWEQETADISLTFLNVAFLEFCQFEFVQTSMVSNELEKLYNQRYNTKAIKSNTNIHVEHDVSSVGGFGLWKLENLPIGITSLDNRNFDEISEDVVPKGYLTLYEISGDDFGSIYVVGSDVLIEILNPGSY
jgi:hypothetical protein